MGFPETVKASVRRKALLQCCLCKSIGVEIHHIIPEAEGGPDIEENAAPLCPSCHGIYGANPIKRKFITEARDLWYDICSKRYAPDADRFERLMGLLEGTTSVLTGFQDFMNRIAKLDAVPSLHQTHTATIPMSAAISIDNDEDDDFQQESRTEIEILEALDRLFDQIWYNRHWNIRTKVDRGEESVSSEVMKVALDAAQRVESKYKDDPGALGPWDDFEWGMLNGKMSALRWVLGDDWDFLDT